VGEESWHGTGEAGAFIVNLGEGLKNLGFLLFEKLL